jgi:phosphinothricin acetyltransferase
MDSGQPDVMVTPMTEGDWPSVREIYMEGIATGNATFETSAPDYGVWDRDHIRVCRLAARSGNDVVGWAALSPVSGRCVYGGVAEVSVYVRENARGCGIGLTLLRALVDASEKAGLWTLQAGIFPENTASIDIHGKAGFRIVGVREKLGAMDDRWRDVVLMERRSTVVG